jgi:hypothetical protein
MKKTTLGLVDNSITYTGKDLDGFFSTALLTGNTKSMIRVVPNVKSKVNLASLDMGDFLQADACDLDESGDYTLDQKTLEVCDIGFKIPFCVKDWEALYLAESMKPGSNVEENYPNGVVDYIMEQISLKISEKTERLLFQGDTGASPADLCDGFQKKWLADSSVIDVAVDGVKLHGETTVIGELTRIYKAIPNTLDKSKLMFGINPKTATAFKLALVATHPALYASNNANLDLYFMDMKLTVCPGLGDYKAFVADPMNLWFGCDLLSDENEVKFEKKPGSKIHWAMGSFKFGTQYGVGAEIVYYN